MTPHTFGCVFLGLLALAFVARGCLWLEYQLNATRSLRRELAAIRRSGQGED